MESSVLEILNYYLKSGENFYILLILTILVASYTTINMFASGTIYRTRISKANTNLDIVEKLLSSNKNDLGDFQKKLCAEIISESLINIKTGYKLSVENLRTYEHVFKLTSKPYLSYFSARIKNYNKSVGESVKKYFFSSLTVFIIILTMLLLGSIISGVILSKSSSLQILNLDLKYKIGFYADTIIMISLLGAYIVSINRLSTAIILFFECGRNKSLRDFR